MLILLSSALREKLNELKNVPGFIGAMDNLAIAFRKGQHIVSGPSSLIEEIIGLLKGDAQGTFRQIKQRHMEEAALRNAMIHAIVVEPFEESRVEIHKEDNKTRYHVSYSYFSDFKRSLRTRLIAEDSCDIQIYRGVAKAYLYKNRSDFRNIELELEECSGGGSSTADQFRVQAMNGLTLCMLDSDKRYPQAKLGNTATNASKVQHEFEKELPCYAEVLPCHELENLIPSDLLLNCLTDRDQEELKSNWKKAHQYNLLCNPEFAYVDMKNGICGHDILNAQPSEKHYLRSLTDQLRALGQACETHPQCCDKTHPGCKKEDVEKARDSCTCFRIYGLGGTALERVAQKMKQSSDQKIAECFFSADGSPIWKRLSELIVAWGCAYKPRKT